MSQIPIHRGFLPRTGEISGLTSPRESGGLNRMWSRVRDQRDRHGSQTNNGSVLQTQVNRKGQKFYNIPSRMFPFKIYQVPYVFQVTNINDPTMWRQFRVRTGYVYPQSGSPFIPTGTDMVLNPDIETYLDQPTVAAASQFTADNNVLQYWVWIDVASKSIKHGATPASQGWTTFPVSDSTHIPIGFIDTQTFNGQAIANVRQLVRSDINVFFSSSTVTFAHLGFDGPVTSMAADGSFPQLIMIVGGFQNAILTTTLGNASYVRPQVAMIDDESNLLPPFYGVVNTTHANSVIFYNDSFQAHFYVACTPPFNPANLSVWQNANDSITDTGSWILTADNGGNLQVGAFSGLSFGGLGGLVLINETVNSSTISFLVQCTSLTQSAYGPNAITGLFRLRRDGVFLFNFPFQTSAGASRFVIPTMVQKNTFTQNTYILANFGAGSRYNGGVIPSKFFLVANSNDSLNPSFADQNGGFSFSPSCFLFTQSGGFATSFFFAGVGSGVGLAYSTSGPKFVVKVTPLGALDASFSSGITSISGGPINGILIQQTSLTNAAVLVFGSFTSVNGGGRSGIFRMNPTGLIDTTFSNLNFAGSLLNPFTINAVLVHPTTGFIYVGGAFVSVNGSPRSNFCVLDANGNLM